VGIYNWNNKNMKIVTFAITERPSQGVDQARAQPSQGRQLTPTLKVRYLHFKTQSHPEVSRPHQPILSATVAYRAYAPISQGWST